MKLNLIKMGEYVKNFVLDSGRELIQILFLIICVIIPKVINLAESIENSLVNETLTIENAKYYYLMISGNWAIGCFIALYVLFYFIRKSNKEKIFNRGNVYHDKPYWWYWLCSKILGYKKCNLILVPIYIQYKLILRDTFEEYPFEKDAFPQRESEVKVERKFNEENVSPKEINLIIQDTYPINDGQIPLKLKTNNTIIIKRIFSRFGERVYSSKFVDCILEEIRKLDNDITLNIFSTTNPKNTYEIVKKAIALAGRGNVKHVNVFQQSSDVKRAFVAKPHKVM